MLKRNLSLILLLMVVMVAGCNASRLKSTHDRQMEAMDRTLNAPKMYVTNMIDNAILHDMSLSDIHFVAHSVEISGTGVARLDRMALLLNTYGGIVRYETMETDQEMIKARLAHIEEYLTVVGCEMENVEIKLKMNGGRGMAAKQALALTNAQEQARVDAKASGVSKVDLSEPSTGASNN